MTILDKMNAVAVIHSCSSLYRPVPLQTPLPTSFAEQRQAEVMVYLHCYV